MADDTGAPSYGYNDILGFCGKVELDDPRVQQVLKRLFEAGYMPAPWADYQP